MVETLLFGNLRDEKTKLESTLTSDQDKHLRKIKDLRETIELEMQSKRHLDDMLRMELGEKDDLIQVLRTQIDLLKTERDSASSMRDVQPDMGGEIILSLQDRLQSTTRQMEKLRKENNDMNVKLRKCEEEKDEAMEKVRKDMEEVLEEVQQLRSQISNLEGDLKKRDEEIMNMKDRGSQDAKLHVEYEINWSDSDDM